MGFIKYTDNTIGFIERFKNIKKCKVALSIDEVPTLDGELEFSSENIKLTLFVSMENRFDYTIKRNLKLEIDKKIYLAENFYIIGTNGTYKDANNGLYEKYLGNIHDLKFGKDDDDSLLYRRVVIPLDKNINFIFYLETLSYNVALNVGGQIISSHSNLVRVKINDDSLDYFIYYNLKEKLCYLVIDSSSKILQQQFHEFVYNILLTYSLISGFFPYGESYYFGSEDFNFDQIKSMRYLNHGVNLSSSYNTVYANSHAYQHLIGSELAEKYKLELKEIDQTTFAGFVTKVNNNKDLQRAIFLFLRASSEELFTQASLFSVVLETISSIIQTENKSNKKKVSRESKKLINYIKEKMSTLLDTDEFLKLDQNVQNRFKKRIQNIDQPLNSELLSNPFKKLGIDLNEDELVVINYRNDFLHGRHPLKEKYDSTFNEMYYLCLRFFVLLAKIILKYLGYSGRIINYPKIHENITKVKLEEEPFVKI